MSTKKLQILNSVLKQAENADTLDGKHASEFALASNFKTLQAQVNDIQKNAYDDTEIRDLVSANASDIDALEELVGDTKVSDQIANAIVNKVDKVDGQRLITTDEADKLKALVIGENGQVGISGTVNADNVQGLAEKLALKVDKVDGKGLSTNDYTTAEKNKLAAIETGANKTVVDSALNETSTNPVQNKVVNAAISDLNTLVGNTKVSDQISDALNNYRADMNAKEGEAGHILNRTHYKEINIVDIIPSGSFELDEYAYCMTEANGRLVAGKTYVATIDGVKYERVATYDEEFEAAYIGNLEVFWGNESENPDDDAFCFMVAEDGMADISLVSSDYANKTITFSVQEFTEVIHKLPLEYLDMPDMNAAEGKPGHVLNRTHYSEPEVILADNVEITTSGMYSWISYNAIKDYEAITVVYDGVTYVCPITFGIDVADYDSKYFKFGGWNDAEYPFYFVGYETLEYAAVTVPEGSHTLSVMAGEYVKKLDKKYLPDDIGGGVSSWNDLTDKPFYVQSNDTVLLDGEFTTKYISDYGVFGIDTAYNEELEAAPEKVTMVYDGVEYKGITFTDIPDLGKVGGNLYHMNALFGTSYENTGEPFILAVSKYGCAIMTLDTAETAHAVKLFIAGESVEKINVSCLPDGLPYTETVMLDPTFDGDMTGREAVMVPNVGYTVKVSSEYISVSDMIGGTLVCDIGGTEYTMPLTDENVVDATSMLGVPGTVILNDGGMVAASFPAETTAMGVTLSAGTWFGCVQGQFYVKSISCLAPVETETIHKLDNKFIDAEWMATTSVKKTALYPETEFDCISAIGNGGINVNKGDPEYVDIKVVNGETYIFTVDGVEYNAIAMYMESEDVYFVTAGDNLGLLIFDGGIHFYCGSTGLHKFALYKNEQVANKIPMKYLPEGYPYTEKVTGCHPFDGDMTGKEAILFQEGTYAVKVSSEYVEVSDVIGSTMVLVGGDVEESIEVPSQLILDTSAVFGVAGALVTLGVDGLPIILSLSANVKIEGITLSKGTWFMCMPGQMYVKSLSCLPEGSGEVEVVHKMDEKYLPYSVATKNDINTFYEEHRTHWTDDDGTVHQLDEKYIPAEWLATYVPTDNVAYLSETTASTRATSSGTHRMVLSSSKFDADITLLTTDIKATITFDGVTYTHEAGSGAIGNGSLIDLNTYQGDKTDTGEPFGICRYGSTALFVYTTDTEVTEHTISITLDGVMLPDPLPEKYLPDTVALKSDIENIGSANLEKLTFTGAVNAEYDGSEAKTIEIPTIPTALKNPNVLTINGTSYDGSKAIGLSLMNSINPVGTGFFSMNRKADTAVGYCSHAEGDNTTASGQSSHAEGRETTASGNNSHAEGANTTASGYSSHAEGHGTTASGDYSHAEGHGTTASGTNSHAEGWYTIADGEYSHAEGHYTKASSDSSHVQGKYNIEDTENTYAHIVGNGESGATHSNAHTLDWEGNAWYQGDVYVGSTSGTNRDEGSKKLATEEYVNIRVPAWTDADEGKFLRIVNGTPTWVSIPDAKVGEY